MGRCRHLFALLKNGRKGDVFGPNPAQTIRPNFIQLADIVSIELRECVLM